MNHIGILPEPDAVLSTTIIFGQLANGKLKEEDCHICYETITKKMPFINEAQLSLILNTGWDRIHHHTTDIHCINPDETITITCQYRSPYTDYSHNPPNCYHPDVTQLPRPPPGQLHPPDLINSIMASSHSTPLCHPAESVFYISVCFTHIFQKVRHAFNI